MSPAECADNLSLYAEFLPSVLGDESEALAILAACGIFPLAIGAPGTSWLQTISMAWAISQH
jgi:hypothetical protein